MCPKKAIYLDKNFWMNEHSHIRTHSQPAQHYDSKTLLVSISKYMHNKLYSPHLTMTKNEYPVHIASNPVTTVSQRRAIIASQGFMYLIYLLECLEK